MSNRRRGYTIDKPVKKYVAVDCQGFFKNSSYDENLYTVWHSDNMEGPWEEYIYGYPYAPAGFGWAESPYSAFKINDTTVRFYIIDLNDTSSEIIDINFDCQPYKYGSVSVRYEEKNNYQCGTYVYGKFTTASGDDYYEGEQYWHDYITYYINSPGEEIIYDTNDNVTMLSGTNMDINPITAYDMIFLKTLASSTSHVWVSNKFNYDKTDTLTTGDSIRKYILHDFENKRIFIQKQNNGIIYYDVYTYTRNEYTIGLTLIGSYSVNFTSTLNPIMTESQYIIPRLGSNTGEIIFTRIDLSNLSNQTSNTVSIGDYDISDLNCMGFESCCNNSLDNYIFYQVDYTNTSKPIIYADGKILIHTKYGIFISSDLGYNFTKLEFPNSFAGYTGGDNSFGQVRIFKIHD